MIEAFEIILDQDSKYRLNRIMKTTIDIPDNELRETIKYTGSKTKREAVVIALKDFNKRQRLATLVKMLGTFKDFMTQEDLKVMREDRKWQKKR